MTEYHDPHPDDGLDFFRGCLMAVALTIALAAGTYMAFK